MKYTIQYPTEQYGYIKAESESRDEIVNEYNELKSIFEDKEGLNQNEWAKFRKEFLMSEGKDQDIETHEKLNKSQRWWCHQTELAIKSLIED